MHDWEPRPGEKIRRAADWYAAGVIVALAVAAVAVVLLVAR